MDAHAKASPGGWVGLPKVWCLGWPLSVPSSSPSQIPCTLIPLGHSW